MTGDLPEAWVERAQELTADPDPAWRERGAEILRGEL